MIARTGPTWCWLPATNSSTGRPSRLIERGKRARGAPLPGAGGPDRGVRWNAPVFLGGGARPNARFQALCGLAGIKPRLDIETGEEEPWELKDLRKTCATYYDEHVPESSVEILGHSVGGITYRHYAHRAPLAFRAIMTLPQPSAFSAILRGGDSECPCCRRRFADAG